jgi:formamidase
LNLIHPLTGPIYVRGAMPGDWLEVTIHEVVPANWGFTTIIPGFGYLRDDFLEPFLVKWEVSDGYATSSDLPGVRVPGNPFMGTIGIAPSQSLREEIERREADLLHRKGFVLPPEKAGAVPSEEPVASEGLRTIPPREIGGNMDIKQLTSGCKLLLPISVEGALFSAGDAHFAQGDAEVCGTAIEMNATLRVSFNTRKGRPETVKRFPRFERDGFFAAPEVAVPRRFIATTGIPLHNGTNESEDLTLAFRQALRNMIDLLVERGWTREQAYCICSTTVDFRISEVVDVPNVLVSAFLPLDIFQD